MNRVLFTFTISVLLAIICPKDSTLCFIVPFILAILQISLYFLRKRLILLPLIFGFVFGLFLVDFHQSESKLVALDGETVSCVIEVQSVPWETDYGIGFDGEVVSIDGKDVSEKVICYMDAASVALNTRITLKEAKVKLPDGQLNFNSFDYRRFLESRNVYAVISAKGADISNVETSKWSVSGAAAKVNEKLCRFIDQRFEPQNAALLKGILLGDKSDLSDDVQENFRKSGLSHALAVSGMHLAIIVSILGLFLKRMNRKVRGMILLVVIWVFSFIVGLPISVTRAAFMLTFLIVADSFLWDKDSLTNLALAALILLIQNPNVVYDISFSMSFSATLGILCMVPVFAKIKPKYMPYIIKESLGVSFAALIGSMPVALLYFGRVYFVGLLSNVLVIILIPIVYFLLLLAVVFRFGIFFSFGDFFLSLLSKWADFCSEIPFFSFVAPNHPVLWCGVIGVTLTFLFIGAFRKRRCFVVFVLSFVCVAAVGYKLGTKPPEHTEITFINVEQADCALIRTPSGENFLIDTGTENAAKNEVIPFLEREGVLEIAGIFVSHFDYDHCGGLIEILESFDVNTVYISDTLDVGQAQYAFLSYANACNIRVIPLLKDDIVKTDTITFTVLYPEVRAADNHNASSLVLRADSTDCAAIFTGDLEKDNILTNCDADILKVSHHGSANGSTEAFINNCSPDVAVISLGLNNSYGFPKPEVTERLFKHTKYVYRTDLNGTVRIRCDNKKYYIQTLR